MSESIKKFIRICAGLIFVFPYGISREVGSDGGRVTTVKALLWEIEFGTKNGIPHLALRCPHVIRALLK